ncbi:OmpA family protein [Flavobacterium amnicola]|uniref:OmpA family protein n=1 Tax=Flavobacterium amnicola TaxID=2506422 RepID=A0A4Q1K0A5_9FLAO|nr:OmpA family protein [Flavobacterium amnicola]RXR17247.1 OmpA family protein [Flavobacterium amnicola]
MKNLLLIVLLFGNVMVSKAQEQYEVYFQSNKHTLPVSESVGLEKWILENKQSKILAISGYTDEDGTNQFNDTLAKKRVESVFKLVKDKIKIREDFKKLSFGENHTQSKIKAENRKVIIYFLKEKDLAREAEIIGLKNKEVVQPKPIVFPESIIVTNFDGSQMEYKLDVAFMKSLNEAKTGEKLKIDNLNFVLNTFAVTADSRGKLYELLLVMQQNPNLKISIQGHVCCVQNDRQNLSTQRAKAVKMFLEQKKIDPTRMNFKGFGSTVPLFPIPEKSEIERAANRRVEIEVISN